MRLQLVWLLVVFPALLQAQPYPDTLWTRTYGGDGNDKVAQVHGTSDGGFIVCGYSNSFGSGGYDFYLLRLDSLGGVLWQQTYGSSGNDYGADARETRDGGFVVVGTIPGADDHVPVMLVKTDAWGDTSWTHVYVDTLHCALAGVAETDSGFAVFGQGTRMEELAGNGCLTLTIDHDGNLQQVDLAYGYWGPGGTQVSSFADVEFVAGLGGAVCGGEYYQTYFPEPYEYYTSLVGRWNPSGGSMWAWSRSNQWTDISARKVALARDEKVFVLSADNSVSCLSPVGQLLWTCHIDEPVRDICPGPQGEVVFCRTARFQTDDIELWATDSTAATLWRRVVGSPEVNEDVRVLELVGGGGYLLAGVTQSQGGTGNDIYIVRTGPDSRPAGYVTLLQAGPPAWGYQLHRTNGWPARHSFTGFCTGTSGAVSGDAADHWHVLTNGDGNNGDSVIFVPDSGLVPNFSTVDTFWLIHPTCTGNVTWSGMDSSGTLDGPFSSPAATISVDAFSANLTDSGTAVMFHTVAERDIAALELRRNVGGTGPRETIAQFAAQGSADQGSTYTYFDRGAGILQDYWYFLAQRDIFGWTTELSWAGVTATHSTIQILGFEAEAEADGIRVRLETGTENHVAFFEVWRSDYEAAPWERVVHWPSQGNRIGARTYKFLDGAVQSNKEYIYRPVAEDSFGVRVTYDALMRSVVAPDLPPVAHRYSLIVFPNPFNVSAILQFHVPVQGPVRIDVYDLSGRLASRILDDMRDPGTWQVSFDASDSPSGVYFAHMTASGFAATQKLVLLK